MTEPTADWITYAEAARRLSLSVNTVQRMVAAGEVVQRPGNHYGVPSIDATSVARASVRLDRERAAAAAHAGGSSTGRRGVRGAPDDGRVWLNSREVGAALGRDREWLAKQARRQLVPATWHGGQWWVTEADAAEIAERLSKP